ncbi:thiamine pyrophosphokinase [Pleomorphovibrio marinus]|uniref:thiamine pyrophosphokinase n=1 Tax=Pleomorphovibrio marinus TaxID=2164132 RepID=UPI000E0C00F4|nr:thiamine pyrophosphokinase [Pleomorphovibrio marinus]
MSSHHFVKEQQEPAILFLDLKDFPFSRISSLLEWSPTVLCNQDSIEKVLAWGVKVDVLLGQDLFLQTDLIRSQEPVHCIRVEGSGVQEQLKIALHYLRGLDQEALNVIGFSHQELLEMEVLFQDSNVVVWDGQLRYVHAKNGHFRKWWPASSLHLHAREDSFIEKCHNGKSELLPIKYATFVEVEQGITSFKGTDSFWVGEFTDPAF